MSSEKSPALRSPQTGVLLLLALATAVKTAWAFNSQGSADAHLFYLFGKVLQSVHLRDLYTLQPLFNHTPLMGAACRLLYRVCGGDFQAFSSVFRCFAIASDAVVVLGLLHVRRVTGNPPWWALALFAASPVSIMVSGFHASPDPVLVMLLFLAAVAVLHGRPALCGILFALACNVKAIAALLTPLFAFYWFARGVRPSLRFAIPCGAVLLAGSALPLWQCPAPYLQHVFGYGGYWGWWGVSFWLKETGIAVFQKADFQNLSPAQNMVMTALKLVIIGGILFLSWRRRLRPAAEFFGTIGAAWVVLFVFATGAGVHYMVWFAPFILLLAPSWFPAFTAASAVFVFAFYQIGSEHHAFPWVSSIIATSQIPLAAPWSNLPWLVFLAFFALDGKSWFQSPPAFLLSPAESPVLTPASQAGA